MPDQRCADNDFIFQDSTSLHGTDDPRIGEKVMFFEFSKAIFQPKAKTVSNLIKKLRMIISTTIGGYFSIKLVLTFCLFQ